MAEFCHLHVHTEYSILDGLTKPEELAQIVSSNGQVASAITDHGTMGGFIRFQQAAIKEGIKPIFGVEAIKRKNASTSFFLQRMIKV